MAVMRTACIVAALGATAYAVDDWRLAALVSAVAAALLTRSITAVAAGGAAGVHFAVAPEHFGEWWGFGLFFVLCAETQLAWALSWRVRAPRGGAVASALLIVVWLVTRTTGLPFGPEPGEPEAIGAADLVTVALEAVTVAAVLVTRTRRPTQMIRISTAVAALVVTGALVAGAVAATPSHPMTMKHQAMTAAGLRVTLDQLLGEHAALAMNATNQGYSGQKSFASTAKQLDRNSVALSQAIGSIYGAKAGNAFLNGRFMWRDHIRFFVAYTVALAKDDQAGQAKAVTNLKLYTVKFGDFLAGATGLPKLAVRGDLLGHVFELKNQLDAYAGGRYAQANALYHAAYDHMFMTGDTLASAIAKQKHLQ
jgi:hypothetical protein